MPDVALRADRPYSLVTTVAHAGSGHCRVAQLDLHCTSGDLRLRFLDRSTLAHFCNAVAKLALDAYLPAGTPGPAVHTRVYTDRDRTAGPKAEQLFLEGLFGPPE